MALGRPRTFVNGPIIIGDTEVTWVHQSWTHALRITIDVCRNQIPPDLGPGWYTKVPANRRADRDMSSAPRMSTNGMDGLAALPAMCCTTLGTAAAPTVSSPDRGDQLYRVAQSTKLSEARAGRPEAAAAERLGCGIPWVR